MKFSIEVRQQCLSDYISGMTYKAAGRKNGVSLTFIWRLVKNAGEARPGIQGYLRGPAHPFWRGGKTKNHRGYIELSNRTREHRVIGELLVGRKLNHWEVVHHIDDNKINNAEDNLVVMPMREHSRFHTFLRHRSFPVNNESLIKFCFQESKFYYRFTKKMHDQQTRLFPSLTPIRAHSPSKKCRVVKCGFFGKLIKRFCSKHYQRSRAKIRGYWLSGGGRRAKFYGKCAHDKNDAVATLELSTKTSQERDEMVARAKAARLPDQPANK